jgi:histidinol-phosphate aminotransferase
LGVRTYPTETYFFLADFTPHDAADLAARLRERNILVKPLNDPALGRGFMRITTALPDANLSVITTVAELLRS